MLKLVITGELEPTGAGTHFEWNMKLNGALPRWIRQRLCRQMISKKWQLKENFGVMAELMDKAGNSA